MRMPALFIGHGSPMNAIADNDYTRALRELGESLSRPAAILCVSAHWMTQGAWVTHMPRPRTIHDFGGFPRELFEVRYPAPGSPETAELVRATVTQPRVQLDDSNWGLDHGAWSVLRHMYPRADVPVIQLSIDPAQTGDYHLRLGEQLRPLRDQGILIVGSGNVVHNLRRIVWEADAPPMPWAVEFDAWAKEKVLARDHRALATDYERTEAGRLSVPTPDHYYPFLASIGASDPNDRISFLFEGIQNGSIAMRSIKYG